MKKIVYLFLIAAVVASGCNVKGSKPPQEKNVKESTPPQEKREILYKNLGHKIAVKAVPHLLEENSSLLSQGTQYAKKGAILEAIKLYMAAMKMAPFDNRPYSSLANLYFGFGQDDKAFKILEKAGKGNTNSDLVFKALNVQDILSDKQPLEPSLPRISIAQFKDNKQCAITFGLDDGYRNAYTKLLPIFDKFGFKATVALMAGRTHENITQSRSGNWEEWRDAQKRGFEIANHSMSHPDLIGKPVEILEREINGAYDIIQKEIGKPPLSFVFPGNDTDTVSMQKVLERHIAIRDHDFLVNVYKNIFIPVYGGNYFSEKTARLIVYLSIHKKLWLIAQLHDVVDKKLESYKPVSTEFLHSHLSYIKANEDKIWVDTFINIYRYLFEKKVTDIRIKEDTGNSITFVLVNSLDPEIFYIPLTVVINTDPVQPSTASARQEGVASDLPIKIDGKKIYVSTTPNTPPVHVKWD